MASRREFLKIAVAGIAGLAIGAVTGYSLPRPVAQQSTPRPASSGPRRRVKALWVYVGPIGDYGWTHAHHVGKERVDEEFEWLETKHLEKVREGEAAKRVEGLLEREEFDAVFFTSYGYMDAVKYLAEKYPEVKFYHCSGPWEEFREYPNVVTYFAEFYQLYYLNGLAAGAVTETCRVGYVPAYLIPEVVRHINAYAIGAVHGAKVAGKCGGGERIEVYVTPPLASWFDPQKAQSYARMLVEQYNVDVVAYTEDSTAILELAEKYWDEGRKVYSFSHYSNMYEYFEKQGKKLRSHLTGQVADWTPIHAYLLSKLYSGAYEKEDVWARLGDFTPIRWRRPLSRSKAGSPEGAVYLAPLNREAIPGKALQAIIERYEETRELLFEPFTGPLRGYAIDENGRPQEAPRTKVETGKRLGRDELWSMNWFYEKITSLSS